MSGLLLVAFAGAIALAPRACRPMTPAQERRWTIGLGIGALLLLVLAVAAAVYTTTH